MSRFQQMHQDTDPSVEKIEELKCSGHDDMQISMYTRGFREGLKGLAMSQNPTSNDVEKRDTRPVAWRCRTTDEPDWKYGESSLLAKDLFRKESGFEEQPLYE
jgi:hypothetical protein